MKKITGWLIIGFCSIFLALFLVFLTILFLTLESFESIPQVLTGIAGYIFMISLTIIGIRFGIKKTKNKKQVEPNKYTEPLNINFKGQINYEEYRNIILRLTYGKPIYLFLILIIFASIITSLTTDSDKTIPINVLLFLSIFIGLIILSPLLTLFKIKKTYKTNSIFLEELNYNINNESIHIKGNSVDSNQKWNHFYKIKETKSFFMLYQSDMIATLIEKNMLNPNEVKELRIFFQSLNLE